MIKLGIISKNTILKAIHNVYGIVFVCELLGIISKNTILKAIHNGCSLLLCLYHVGNYK